MLIYIMLKIDAFFFAFLFSLFLSRHQIEFCSWYLFFGISFLKCHFMMQVERFACLYTSQVSNLSLYSPDKYYRPSEDYMPHEFDIIPL